MSAAHEIVDALIAGGMHAAEAAALLARAAVEMTSPARSGPTAGAARMSDYRDRREAMGLPRIFPANEYRPKLIDRDGDRCIYCEAAGPFVIDHIHPIFLGGNDDLGNLGLACRPCNGRKAGRPLEDHGMEIVVATAARAHEDYKSRTLFTPLNPEQSSPRPRTPAHNGAQVHPQQNPPISTSKISKESKRQNRGTRIAADWSLSDTDRAFAKAEGFSDWEIQREAQKFRDYWTACAGSKGVKLDWPATWRQWIRSGAERAGKTPSRTAAGPMSDAPGYYAKADSEQLAAWDAYTQRTTGKLLPRDRNFGWRVASEWPPDQVPVVEKAPLLRGML